MKIAINGFGRIGRSVFKIAFEKGIDIAAVNDVYGAEDAAYFLKYDSVYGRYDKKVEVKGGELIVNGKKIKVLSEREPLKLPWKKMKVDVVVEATGAFREGRMAEAHLKAGARYVIVTAPIKKGKPDLTVVPGVNDDKLSKNTKLISVASCTTNCLAPLVKVLNDSFGVEKAFFTTVHGYTSSQALVDSSARKVVRGRAAALNIVPTSSGASEATAEAIPEMKGKIDGMALRVPVACGSITDLSAELSRFASVEGVNNAFRKYSNGKGKGILSCTKEEMVSSDVIGSSESAIFMENETKVNGKLVKVMAWYDNEWGYSNSVVDVVKMLR